jgi:transposase InsO family protein
MLVSFYVCLLVGMLICGTCLYSLPRSPKPVFKRRAVIRHVSAMAVIPKNQRKPEWVRAELIRLAALCGGSRRNVARVFNRLHGAKHGVTVGHSFTCDLLKAHAVQALRLRRTLKSRQPKVVPICETWAMDLTFYTGDDKVTRASIGIIDHGSRALLCLRTLTVRNSWTLLGYLCLAIGRYGKPRKLRTDNEIIFNSFVFKTFLKLVGIQKQTTDVHSPWQNGRMERLFGTLKPVLRALHLNGQVTIAGGVG